MSFRTRWLSGMLVLALIVGTTAVSGQEKKGRRSKKAQEEDPYASYVWPPPPNEPRIKLEAVVRERADVEASSGFLKMLIGMEPKSPWDTLMKPFDVAFDPQGRVLVTDIQTAGLLRIDLEERRFDVFGTQGSVKLKMPLGLTVAPNGEIFVADRGRNEIVVFDPDGKLRGGYSAPEFQIPTDVAVARGGETLYVTDAQAHCVWILDRASGKVTGKIGTTGEDPGEFHTPGTLAVTPEGNLAVVDQLNSRVQFFAPDGESLGVLGRRGSGFGNFIRPKGIAVDEVGFIYVTDFLQGFVQLFDFDFTMLTFIGSRGVGPGQFDGASGIAVQGDRIAVVDQLGRRVQLFRFIVPKDAE